MDSVYNVMMKIMSEQIEQSMTPSCYNDRTEFLSLTNAENIVTRWICLIIVAATTTANAQQAHQLEPRVGATVTVYDESKFYSAFPSVIRRADGELLLAFRRAPERRPYGQGVSHTDPNSNLVLVRSKDNGVTWDKQPQLMYAHPFGGSQDPCMVQLKDGTILCTSYAWAQMLPDAISKLKPPIARHDRFVSLGGYLLKSKDAGRTWQPFTPPSVPGEKLLDIFAQPLPALNRGAIAESRNGELYWVVSASVNGSVTRTANHLMRSADQGETWNYGGIVAQDPKIIFNEASLIETAKGDWVAFLRTENHDDQTVIARSTDGGKTFQWKDAGFRGHPHHAIRLPDQRVLLVYGYRHKPYGIRALILNSECTNAETAPEIVLRDDGGNSDLGYPWATMVGPDRALVVYYFNTKDGIRHISGTFIHFDETRLPRDNLLLYRGQNGKIEPVLTPEDWTKRRAEILRGFESVAGTMPGQEKRCNLDMKSELETDCGSYIRKSITYQSEPGSRVPAYLCIPKGGSIRPAMLCLHPTDNEVGHGTVIGLGKRPSPYAVELAERGYVTLAPAYPLLAKYQPDLKALGWSSGTLKAVWDNKRGIDVLESLPEVDGQRIGVIGHSLGGHNGVFTAVFDARLKAVVSSCGMDSFLDYYGGIESNWQHEKGWCQTRYMPKLASYRGRMAAIPFDFHELIGTLSPRHVAIYAPKRDSNFHADSVDRIVSAARQVFRLDGHPDRLRVEHPDIEHSFPAEQRAAAYKFLESALITK